MVFLWFSYGFPKDEWLTPAIARGEVMFHSSRCGHCQWLGETGFQRWVLVDGGSTFRGKQWQQFVDSDHFGFFFLIERLEEHRFLQCNIKECRAATAPL